MQRLTQHVDDAFIVRSKQSYGVFEEQHEGGVDHSVGELVGVWLDTQEEETTSRSRSGRGSDRSVSGAVYLEVQQGIELVLDVGQSLDQLLRVHGAHHAVGAAGGDRHKRQLQRPATDFHISLTFKQTLTFKVGERIKIFQI